MSINLILYFLHNDKDKKQRQSDGYVITEQTCTVESDKSEIFDSIK